MIEHLSQFMAAADNTRPRMNKLKKKKEADLGLQLWSNEALVVIVAHVVTGSLLAGRVLSTEHIRG